MLHIHPICSQLVGSRGVVQLPDGYQYRDQQTIMASEEASRFAKHFQPINDIVAEQNKLVELQRNRFKQEKVPVFFTFGELSLAANKEDTLFFTDSRYIQTAPENRRQKDNLVRKQEPLQSEFRQTVQKFGKLPDLSLIPASLTANSVVQLAPHRQTYSGVNLPQYSTKFSFNLSNLFGI